MATLIPGAKIQDYAETSRPENVLRNQQVVANREAKEKSQEMEAMRGEIAGAEGEERSSLMKQYATMSPDAAIKLQSFYDGADEKTQAMMKKEADKFQKIGFLMTQRMESAKTPEERMQAAKSAYDYGVKHLNATEAPPFSEQDPMMTARLMQLMGGESRDLFDMQDSQVKAGAKEKEHERAMELEKTKHGFRTKEEEQKQTGRLELQDKKSKSYELLKKKDPAKLTQSQKGTIIKNELGMEGDLDPAALNTLQIEADKIIKANEGMSYVEAVRQVSQGGETVTEVNFAEW